MKAERKTNFLHSVELTLNADCLDIYPNLDMLSLLSSTTLFSFSCSTSSHSSFVLSSNSSGVAQEISKDKHLKNVTNKQIFDANQTTCENNIIKINELSKKSSLCSLDSPLSSSKVECNNHLALEQTGAFKGQENLHVRKIRKKNRGNLVCVGMYHLIEEQKRRIGGFYFTKIKFKKNTEQDNKQSVIKEFKNYYEKFIDLPYGVLDLKWILTNCFKENSTLCNFSSDDLPYENARLACVSTECAVHIFNVTEKIENKEFDLKCLELKRFCLFDSPEQARTRNHNKNITGLAFDISNLTADLIGFTCSDGNACIIKDCQCITSRWKAHDAEVWTLSFDKNSQGINFCTGADDSILKIWDMRQSLSSPAYINKKSHTMGITSTNFFKDQNNILLTGCYDEYLRIWDMRNITKPFHEQKLSGATWRISTSGNLIFLANCLGGAEVWKFCDSSKKINKVAEHTAHNSLVYGIGVSLKDSSSVFKDKKKSEELKVKKESYNANVLDNYLLISCSFYDKAVHFWTI